MISVCIPVYNEEKVLEEHVKRVASALDKLKEKYEILIIDDNSTDATAKIAKNLSGGHIRFLHYKNGPSRRENLAKSFSKTTGDVIAFMDIDLATSLDHLTELFGYVRKGYDIATGSRRMGLRAEREFSRRAISFLYNTFIRMYLRSNIHDHQCGFKAFRRKVALKLVKEMGYDTGFVRGWFWDAELLVRAQRRGYRIKEFPVRWAYGDKTSFILARELRMLTYVLALRFRL